MKKYIFFILLILLLSFSGCDNNDIESIADLVVLEINLPSHTSENLIFKDTYNINGLSVNVEWIPDDTAVISVTGEISKDIYIQTVSINIIVAVNGMETSRTLGPINVLPLTDDEFLNLIKEELDIPVKAYDHIKLPENISLLNKTFTLIWSSDNPGVISDKGVISFCNIEQHAAFSVTATCANYSRTFTWGDITVPAQTDQEHIDFVYSKIIIPDIVSADIDLPSMMYDVYIFWSSSAPENLRVENNKKAVWIFSNDDKEIYLTATFIYNEITVEKKFPVIVKTIPPEERLRLALSTINIPELITGNITLPTVFSYNVTGRWISNSPSIIDEKGNVYLDREEHFIILTLSLESEGIYMDKTFSLKTKKLQENESFDGKHYHVDYASEMELDNNPNLKKANDRIVLMPDSLSGVYESPVFLTNNFTSLVGSWAALSSPDATVELKFRVRVNEVWSEYFSYGEWGLGRQNAMNTNQNYSLAKMNEDILTVNNNKTADALQYTVTLKRRTLQNNSPELTLIAVALEIKNYTFPVDVSGLPNFVDYDVPKLYQHDVPSIGGIICSPTSSTMLLLYKGHEIEGAHPHETIAGLVRDYGNNIYGNWVYNTVGIGSYGEIAYVKRVYSWEELQYHLATVGPVALSIKGNTGLYNTQGHLIVVRGYEITEQGTKIICNDPNVTGVYVKYDLSVFLGFTRNYIYVVE